MEFKGIKIDFAGMAQVLLGLAGLLTAWKGRQIAKEKANAEKEKDENQGK